MSNIYVLAKSLHRLFLFLTVLLGGFMMVTGIMLKYSFLTTEFRFIDLGLIRYLHNNLSLYFSIALFVMIVTGSLMYVLPVLIRRKTQQPKLPQQPQEGEVI